MNISAEITGLGYLHPELFLAPHVTAIYVIIGHLPPTWEPLVLV